MVAANTAVRRVGGKVKTTRAAIDEIGAAGAHTAHAGAGGAARNSASTTVARVLGRIDACVATDDIGRIGATANSRGTRTTHGTGHATSAAVVRIGLHINANVHAIGGRGRLAYGAVRAARGRSRTSVATPHPSKRRRNDCRNGARLQPPLKTVHLQTSMKKHFLARESLSNALRQGVERTQNRESPDASVAAQLSSVLEVEGFHPARFESSEEPQRTKS